MKLHKVQKQSIVLNNLQQSKIKGGTGSSNAITAIVIEDIDAA